MFAALAAISLASYMRSRHAIADLQAPATTFHGEPIAPPARRPAGNGPSLRVAVIGGMTFTGFWGDLALRYEQQHGTRLDLITTGEKNDIAYVFRTGGVDVITMHACDTIVNLVVDGYALDPQPWLRNDLVIVGPPEDPAGIRGMTDAAAALTKIASARSPFVVHSSLGSQEVLRNILGPGQIILDARNTMVMFSQEARTVLLLAAEKHAYTLVGRIPFLTGKLPNNGLEMMVRGDPRLRRPYLMAVGDPAHVPGARLAEARRFAAWVREPQTQAWIAEYGRGKIDDQPLFFRGVAP